MAKNKIKTIGDKLDKETVIWKYMDIWAYLDLIKRKSLHFTRLDKFISDDPSEGLATYQYIKCFFPALTRGMAKEEKQKFIRTELDRKIDARRFYAVSCWNMNINENMAMWNMYASKDFGLAIKTTIEKLTEELENSQELPIMIGKILYQDRTSKRLDYIAFHDHHFFIKNPHYEYEKELRILIDRQPSKPPEAGKDWSSEKADDTINDSGVSIPIQLESMIDEIRLSPYLSGYQFQIIKDITSKYGLNAGIVKKSEYEVASLLERYKDGIKILEETN